MVSIIGLLSFAMLNLHIGGASHHDAVADEDQYVNYIASFRSCVKWQNVI
jgi:hypothetical protein